MSGYAWVKRQMCEFEQRNMRYRDGTKHLLLAIAGPKPVLAIPYFVLFATVCNFFTSSNVSALWPRLSDVKLQ